MIFYRLSSSLNQGRHAPATGIGSIGANGFASYFEICDFLKKQGSSRVFDNETKVPYAYNFLDWISYDDEISIKIKVQNFISNNLVITVKKKSLVIPYDRRTSFTTSLTLYFLTLPSLQAV